MSNTEKTTPLIYLILGAPNSTQMEVTRDLIEGALYWEKDPVLYYPNEHCAPLPKDASIKGSPYSDWSKIPGDLDTDALFIVAQGHMPPPTQIEGLKELLERSNYKLGRIITLVNCQLAIDNPELKDWFDCCLHFSDYALLSHREGISQKLINAFIKHYAQECYPCTFEQLKKSGHVSNPAEILIPEARRIATLFDDIDAIDAPDLDPNNLPDGPIDIKHPEDKYLKRYPDGSPEIRLADIMKWI